jgi:hypothetical protein
MTAVLRPTTSGNYDHAALTSVAQEARAKGDTYGYLRAIGAPEHIAKRAAAHAEVRKNAAPGVSLDVLHRAGEQGFQMLTGTSITDVIHGNNPNPPSESYLRARVAELGRQVAADKVAPEKRSRVEKRGHCDSCDDPNCTGVSPDDFDQEEEN